LRSSAFYLVAVISTVILLIAPLRQEIEPQHKPQLEQLIMRLKVQGFTGDELEESSQTVVSNYMPGLLKKREKVSIILIEFGLLTKKSIERGQRILRDNRESFQKIENIFGVDKEVILGI